MVLLTRAGLHIEPDALNTLTIALGTLPVTMDALGIALTTMLWKKWSFLEVRGARESPFASAVCVSVYSSTRESRD